MNVKEVIMESSFPTVPQEGKKFEMKRITYKIELEPEENRLEVLSKLSREQDAIKDGCQGKDTPKYQVSDVTVVQENKDFRGKVLTEDVLVTLTQEQEPKDNTQRIRDVKNLIPVEMEKWIKSVYIVDDRVCVKANYLKLTDYTILAKFMDESLGAKRITDGKESRWELP